MTIYIHSVVEDIKRAIHSVLKTYFIGSQTKMLNGQLINFPNCTIYYDIRELETDKENKNPIIAIVGNRSTSVPFKCSELGVQGNVNRIVCSRTVYIKTLNIYPLTNPDGDNVSSKQLADITWGLLNGVFKTKKIEFGNSGINKINFSDTPGDASNSQETILIGTVNFEVDSFSFIE